MRILDIAEVVEQTGLRPSTLRYYEEIGLIKSIGRQGLRRQFTPETIMQLSLITLGKSAGFSLDEISGMFGEDGQPNLSREDLRTRADDLDRQIHDLTVLSKALRHVANCSAPSHMECPKFQKLIRVAKRQKRS
ncbi:MerR family transcriptional regulator [Kiloniella litopenaei]|uniref:MerR family transcriptional regulator n=1 Tax=Kiloniella litopenaei TaxID=1549748 RepID=A0A0M2R6E6_9PROT|nr:helix-turn-helix domain-containing protein [Kiloniella litopenaei]KKJ77226.1 MerR family transcriptional regulator [Kiloniella litopenaei]